MATEQTEQQALKLVAPVGTSSAVEQAPSMVHAVVSRLLSPSAIRAAVTTYDGGDPTVWAVYAVSDRAIAHVEIEYYRRLYTAEVERDVPRYRGGYPSATIRQAWARPLNSITELSIADRPSYFIDGEWWAMAATVRFRDVAEPLALPDQSRIYDDDQRGRTDELLDAIRDSLGC